MEVTAGHVVMRGTVRARRTRLEVERVFTRSRMGSEVLAKSYESLVPRVRRRVMSCNDAHRLSADSRQQVKESV